MATLGLDPNAYADRLAALLVAERDRLGRALSRDDVLQSILIASADGTAPTDPLAIHRELTDLAGYIKAARAEIAAIRPTEIADDHLSTASDELDAVIAATEDATNRIMDAAEQIMASAGVLEGEASARISDLSLSVIEACNFQDITGQRITKVVRTLVHIEDKIQMLVAAMGTEAEEARRAAADARSEAADATPTDADLLNGPQMPDQAMGQADIDRLLSGD